MEEAPLCRLPVCAGAIWRLEAPSLCHPTPSQQQSQRGDTFPQRCTVLSSCRVWVQTWWLRFLNHLLAFVAMMSRPQLHPPFLCGWNVRGLNQAFRVIFVGYLLRPLMFCILSEVLVSVLRVVILQRPWSCAASLATEPLVLFAFVKPLPLKLSRREISGLRKDFKNQCFLKLIKLLLYEPLIVWCLYVVCDHLTAHFHEKRWHCWSWNTASYVVLQRGRKGTMRAVAPD